MLMLIAFTTIFTLNHQIHSKCKFRLRKVVLTLTILTILGFIGSVPATCSAQVYDATADFSSNANPNGVWSYGWTSTLGSLILYDAHRTIPFVGPSGEEWYPAPEADTDRPDVVYWIPGSPQLSMAAGPAGEYSVVRWTAPANGTYLVDATFSGFWAMSVVDGDVHVLVNSQHLFDSMIGPQGIPPTLYSGQITVAQGDTIDFVLGIGANGTNSFDRAILSTHISLVENRDTLPPVINNVSATPSVLWPPNHSMRDVMISYDATDDSGSVNCTLSVTSNEGTSSDWEIIDAHHIRLRAKRAGRGNGRVYTIAITCTDSSNNSSSETVTVIVPHDQR
jgi:hypothetical protein